MFLNLKEHEETVKPSIWIFFSLLLLFLPFSLQESAKAGEWWRFRGTSDARL